MEFFASVEFISLVALLAARFALSAVNDSRFQSPFLWTIDRWLKLALFSLATACVLKFSLGFENFAASAAVGALVYFGLESLLFWLNISIVSDDDSPLFAPYSETDSAWRPEKKFLDMKRSIESRGFSKSGSFKSGIGREECKFFLTTFDSSDKKIRLSVKFVPFGKAWLNVFIAESFAGDGTVFRTEANFIPFGLAFPKNYDAARFPLETNPVRLLKKHESRVEKSGKKIAGLPENPLEWINGELNNIERENVARGFINDRYKASEFGKLTPEGKNRLWWDAVITAYFPTPGRLPS